jgi:hypothetical protein
MACLDFASKEQNLDEAHFRQILSEPEWLYSDSGKIVCQ